MISGERQPGDVTSVSTEFGKLIIEFVVDGAIVREPGTMRPIAKFNTRNTYEVLKMIRRTGSFLKMKRNLEQLGVNFAPEAMDLLMAQFSGEGGKLRFESPERRTVERIEKALTENAKKGGRKRTRPIKTPAIKK